MKNYLIWLLMFSISTIACKRELSPAERIAIVFSDFDLLRIVEANLQEQSTKDSLLNLNPDDPLLPKPKKFEAGRIYIFALKKSKISNFDPWKNFRELLVKQKFEIVDEHELLDGFIGSNYFVKFKSGTLTGTVHTKILWANNFKQDLYDKFEREHYILGLDRIN